jgi:hypothetical protein
VGFLGQFFWILRYVNTIELPSALIRDALACSNLTHAPKTVGVSGMATVCLLLPMATSTTANLKMTSVTIKTTRKVKKGSQTPVTSPQVPDSISDTIILARPKE